MVRISLLTVFVGNTLSELLQNGANGEVRTNGSKLGKLYWRRKLLFPPPVHTNGLSAEGP